MAFEALKERQAAAWNSGQFELLADTAADIHDDLVKRLGVRPGERWLDLATGTGPVAIRAARQGASVTGQDFAAALIATARRTAAGEGLAIEFDVGDCERPAYPDASFDVVSSAQGAVFAPDHHAVARELGRLCRPGGRIGLSAWRPGGGLEGFLRMMGGFQPPPPPGAGSPLDWGRRDYAENLLGEQFTLSFYDGTSPQLGASPQALWDLFLAAFGPVRALAAALDERRRQEFHDAFTGFYDGYLLADGSVSAPREYVVIIGHRRG